MTLQLPRTIKNIIRHHQNQCISKQKYLPSNIFQNFDHGNSAFRQSQTCYNIVGDLEFKIKYFSPKKQQSTTQTTGRKQLQQTGLNTTLCNMTCSVFDRDISYKLSKQKQLELTRHQRTFAQFQMNKNRQQSIKKHLQKRLSYFGTKKISNTMTFESKQIQVDPNPQLIDLINDNIPELWKNSLRDNQKRLKRHVKGNTFKKQVAEQMLQTLKGRTKLMGSIPRIKQQYLTPICSRSHQSHQKKKSFSLKGCSPFKYNFETLSDVRNKTFASIPKINFDQVHKIQYNSANKWRTTQFF